MIFLKFVDFLARKLSPNLPRREFVEKDEGISDEEDTAELKLQLELNEQV
jgi:hypothetical protein